MPTLRKLLSRQIDEMSKGELSEALLETIVQLNDFVNLYNIEYEHSSHLQNRIDRLKSAQIRAHLEFRGVG